MKDVPNPPVDNNELDQIIVEGDAKKAKPNGNGGHREQRAKPFLGMPATLLVGKQKPREFVDSSEIFPNQNVSMFMGDGGTGKSRMALQIALACTTGTQWLGIEVAQGPVLYFSAEDDMQEMTNRLNELCEAEKLDLGEAFELHIFDVVGEEFVLASGERDLIKPMPAYHRLAVTIESFMPVLVILDGFADIFAGNENNRSHAKQFINLIRRISQKYDCHICILGHPSMAGLSSGSGSSGSTGWNNAVRTRIYLKKPDGADAADNLRIFEVMKANYRNPSDQIRWEVKLASGHFVRTQAKSAFDRITLADLDRAKTVFANGNWRVHEQANNWGGYAIADMLSWDVGRGVGAKLRSAEQERNRADIRTYLALWYKNKVIFMVDGPGPDRKPTQFYTNKPA